MNILSYTILSDVKGDAYRKLLDYALSLTSHVTVIIRPQYGGSDPQDELDDYGRSVLHLLRPHLLEEGMVSEWPGTRLLWDAKAWRMMYEYSGDVVKVMSEMGHSLFSWQQPHRPEDICLYRENGEVWLVTIAHERDAFLRLSSNEVSEFRRRLPEIMVSQSGSVL